MTHHANGPIEFLVGSGLRGVDYRLYFLDQDGHIRHFIVLGHDDDEAAIRATDEHANGQAMELWQKSRMVRQFPAGSQL